MDTDKLIEYIYSKDLDEMEFTDNSSKKGTIGLILLARFGNSRKGEIEQKY